MKNILIIFIIALTATTSQSQTYFLNGNAVYLGDDCYQLTPMLSTMNGTVWYADQIDLNEPFDLQFLMNFGILDANGADGMCFVLQTVGTDAIGASGGGMGYQTFGTSLGVEFDTYQNGNFGDPSFDHIGIQTNGNIDHNASSGYIAGPVQASEANVNIEDGEDHVVRVTWDPATQLVRVYFDCVFRLEGTVDLINTVFGGESLVYWGFTAATGGSYNFQTVCLREDILNESQVSICTGASIMLETDGSVDDVYTWTPTDYLDDPTSGSPMANPPITTTYLVSYFDVCGTLTEVEITVNVEDLEVELSNSTLLTCIDTEADLEATINLDLDATYTWLLATDVQQSGNNLLQYAATEPGIYTVEVNVNDQCLAEATIEVEANYSVYNINAGEDQVLNCFNENVTVEVQTNGGNNVIWMRNNEPLIGENSTTLVADEPGTYTVITAHPQSGCLSEDDVVISEDYTTAQITAGGQDSLSCLRPSIALQNIAIVSANEYTITWSSIEGNIVAFGNTNTPLIDAEGDYTITVTDNNTGCTSSQTVFVNETDDFGFDIDQLDFPNIITPNGDAVNTFWMPFSAIDRQLDLSRVFNLYEMQIFNRWGKMVFETTQFNKKWDASDQEDGTYFYVLRYESYCSPGSLRDTHGYIQVSR